MASKTQIDSLIKNLMKKLDKLVELHGLTYSIQEEGIDSVQEAIVNYKYKIRFNIRKEFIIDDSNFPLNYTLWCIHELNIQILPKDVSSTLWHWTDNEWHRISRETYIEDKALMRHMRKEIIAQSEIAVDNILKHIVKLNVPIYASTPELRTQYRGKINSHKYGF